MPYQTPWCAKLLARFGVSTCVNTALSETKDPQIPSNTKISKATFSNDQTQHASAVCTPHTFPFPFQDEAQVITWIMNMIMIAVFKMASMNTTPDRPERKMGNQQVTWNHFP